MAKRKTVKSNKGKSTYENSQDGPIYTTPTSTEVVIKGKASELLKLRKAYQKENNLKEYIEKRFNSPKGREKISKIDEAGFKKELKQEYLRNRDDEVAKQLLDLRYTKGKSFDSRLTNYSAFTDREREVIQKSKHANKFAPAERAYKEHRSNQAQNAPISERFSADKLAQSGEGTAERFRVFPNAKNNVEEYINPAMWIGGMGSELLNAPKDIKEGNYAKAVMAVLGPLAGGAGAGIGAKTGGQFVNNLVNPLAGIKLPKKNSFKSQIDWGKWNKEIPGNSKLLNEYKAIEESSKANGKWMKNPDGSEFQGVPEQFVQQNSGNFKKAFGESKLVNPDGSPTIQYHGSAKKFSEFDESKFQMGDSGYSGKGIYTTPEKTTANVYAKSSSNFHKGKIEPTVYELYGQGNNPIRSTETPDGDLFNFHRSKDWQGDVPIDKQMLDYDVAIRNQRGGTRVAPDHQSYENVFPTNKQLKSAIGNNGMFDMSNPNIYKSAIPAAIGIGAAQTKKQEFKNGGTMSNIQHFAGGGTNRYMVPAEIPTNQQYYQLPFNQLAAGLGQKQKIQDANVLKADTYGAELMNSDAHTKDKDYLQGIQSEYLGRIDDLTGQDLSNNPKALRDLTSDIRADYSAKGRIRGIQEQFNTFTAQTAAIDKSDIASDLKALQKQQLEDAYTGAQQGGSYGTVDLPKLANYTKAMNEYGKNWEKTLSEGYSEPYLGAGGAWVMMDKNTNEEVPYEEILQGLQQMAEGDPVIADYKTYEQNLRTSNMSEEEIAQIDFNSVTVTDENGNLVANPHNPSAKAILGAADKYSAPRTKVQIDKTVSPFLKTTGSGTDKKAEGNPNYLYNVGTFTGKDKAIAVQYVNPETGEEITSAGEYSGYYKSQLKNFSKDNFQDYLNGNDVNLGEGALELLVSLPTDLDLMDEEHRMSLIDENLNVADIQQMLKTPDGAIASKEETYEAINVINDHILRYNTSRDVYEKTTRIAGLFRSPTINPDGTVDPSGVMILDQFNKLELLESSPAAAESLIVDPDSKAYKQLQVFKELKELDLAGVESSYLEHILKQNAALFEGDFSFPKLAQKENSKANDRSKYMLKVLKDNHAPELTDELKAMTQSRIANADDFMEVYDQLAFEKVKADSATNFNVFSSLPSDKNSTLTQETEKFNLLQTLESGVRDRFDGKYNEKSKEYERTPKFMAAELYPIDKGSIGDWSMADNVTLDPLNKLSNTDKESFAGIEIMGVTEGSDGKMHYIGRGQSIKDKSAMDHAGNSEYFIINDPQLEREYWQALAGAENPNFTSNYIDKLISDADRNEETDTYSGKSIIKDHHTQVTRGKSVDGSKYKIKIKDQSGKVIRSENFTNKMELAMFVNKLNKSLLEGDESGNSDFGGTPADPYTSKGAISTTDYINDFFTMGK
tara:strand:+ start:1608 stop:5831 length:4224 start_codon:yes stop_codon:yes gene_type:complete